MNSASDNECAIFESTDTEVTLEFKDTTGTASLKCRNDFRLNNSTGELLRIDSSGDIGLGGITSPLWTTGGGMHLNDAYGIGFGNGGNGRCDFQIVTTAGSTLDFRCGFGADTADLNISTGGVFTGDFTDTLSLIHI